MQQSDSVHSPPLIQNRFHCVVFSTSRTNSPPFIGGFVCRSACLCGSYLLTPQFQSGHIYCVGGFLPGGEFYVTPAIAQHVGAYYHDQSFLVYRRHLLYSVVYRRSVMLLFTTAAAKPRPLEIPQIKSPSGYIYEILVLSVQLMCPNIGAVCTFTFSLQNCRFIFLSHN